MARNPFIPRKIKQPKFIDLPKSAGILDDHAVRKNLATKEGTIEKVPVDDSDIANKKYVDDNVAGTTAVKSTDTLGDNKLIRGDGGSRNVQDSGITADDSDNITGVNDLTIDNDLDVTGESKGSRVLITAGQGADIVGTTKYMKVGNCLLSGTKGLPMTRAGSIVGLGVMINCSSFTTNQSFTYICYKNGVNVFSGSFTVEGTGVVTHETTQARGIDTFVAGDVISLSGAGHVTYTINDTIMTLELQLDT